MVVSVTPCLHPLLCSFPYLCIVCFLMEDTCRSSKELLYHSSTNLQRGLAQHLQENFGREDAWEVSPIVKRKGTSSPNAYELVILVDPGWTNGSHCKAQAYSVGGRGGAKSGRWAPTLGYFSSTGPDTLEDQAGGSLEINHGGQPVYNWWSAGLKDTLTPSYTTTLEKVQWCVGVIRN